MLSCCLDIMKYDHKQIEAFWQKKWLSDRDFNVSQKELLESDQVYYVLQMFPYPSGKIHMGHLRVYTIGDVIARYRAAQGNVVLHPMGWDAFGLPAENAAIERGVSPHDWTLKNIEEMKSSIKSIGISYDWDRELATCLPNYYKHQQEIFLHFLKNNLAYQKESYVNWDPVDNTVLANEQVIDGRGWRSGALVEKRCLNQWFLRVSDFAQELLDGLDDLKNWPENVKLMQKNWIGKSTGAEVRFKFVENVFNVDEVSVYTTRPETLFGASFVGISANHLIAEKVAKNNKDLQDFIVECNKMAVDEETLATIEKKGFNTGLFVHHPLKKDVLLPVFVANFVLMDYGTGAVFACPAHDERDFEFAKKYSLPICSVILPQNDFTQKHQWFSTNSLTMRPLTTVKQDVDNLYELHSDSEVMKYVFSKVSTREEAVDQIKIYNDHYVKHGFSMFGVFDGGTGEFVGKSGLTVFDNGIVKSVEITYTLHKKFWGKGYARELIEFWLHYAFVTLGVRDVIAVIDPENERSQKLAVTAGMRDCGKIERLGCNLDRVCFKADARESKYSMPSKTYTQKSGRMVNSGFLNGLEVEIAKVRVIEELEKLNVGKGVTKFRLRDWGVSRQRYWGCPIPVVYCDDCGVVPEDVRNLPIKLPEDVVITGKTNPLETHVSWKYTKCPRCNKSAVRETDTMDTFFDSSWYFLRFCDPHNHEKPFDENVILKAMPVDEYIGGIEHAILHLLYARFFCKALKQCGFNSVPSEPFTRLVTQGMVCHKTYKSKVTGKWMSPIEAYEVMKVNPQDVEVGSSIKMSKSKQNVVEPKDIVPEYGADTARMFTLSDTPPEKEIEWSNDGVVAVNRFLNKLYNSVTDFMPSFKVGAVASEAMLYSVMPILQEFYASLESVALNKAIAKLREMCNLMSDTINIDDKSYLVGMILKVGNFIIPHITAELYYKLYNVDVLSVDLPLVDKRFLVKKTVELAVQINGKMRGSVVVKTDCEEDEACQVAMNDAKLRGYMDGKEVVKKIFVKNKILNLIVK